MTQVLSDQSDAAGTIVPGGRARHVAFGGFLLLRGRLGDLYGARPVFLSGIALFTLASLACGIAPTQATLVVVMA